jgi:hypothetical protein
MLRVIQRWPLTTHPLANFVIDLNFEHGNCKGLQSLNEEERKKLKNLYPDVQKYTHCEIAYAR